MKTQHTPGPWHVESSSFYNDSHDCYPPVVVKEAVDICEVNASLKERDANARLIAAAPELLAACERAMEDFVGRIPNPKTEPCSHELYTMLNAAITKAKGAK